MKMDTMKKIVMILLGNTIYALAVALFILPNGLITGGTTGLALLFQEQFNIPVSTFVAVFNVVMFIAGAVVLGKAFALTTLFSSFYFPFILGVFEKLLKNFTLTDDTMLATVCAGLMIGVAIGLVIRAGASTGGMDIPPLILNKKFRLPVSATLLTFDCIILGGQMLFGSKEQILYGILLVLLYSNVLDKVLVIGRHQMQVKIISEKYERISTAVQEKLDRGTTLIHMEGGYMREESLAVLTVISNRELTKINEIVMAIDEHAFMIINQVNEVHGRGFTLGKEYR